VIPDGPTASEPASSPPSAPIVPPNSVSERRKLVAGPAELDAEPEREARDCRVVLGVERQPPLRRKSSDTKTKRERIRDQTRRRRSARVVARDHPRRASGRTPDREFVTGSRMVGLGSREGASNEADLLLGVGRRDATEEVQGDSAPRRIAMASK
jgi:hypothetical protein